MRKASDIRTGRHCAFVLHVHMVFVAKYRHPVFTKKIDSMRMISMDICRDFDAKLVEFEGESTMCICWSITFPKSQSLNWSIARKGFLLPF